MYALITLLYYDMLAYRPYTVVVERRLSAEIWRVTVAMNTPEDMGRGRSTSVRRMLYRMVRSRLTHFKWS